MLLVATLSILKFKSPAQIIWLPLLLLSFSIYLLIYSKTCEIASTRNSYPNLKFSGSVLDLLVILVILLLLLLLLLLLILLFPLVEVFFFDLLNILDIYDFVLFNVDFLITDA